MFKAVLGLVITAASCFIFDFSMSSGHAMDMDPFDRASDYSSGGFGLLGIIGAVAAMFVGAVIFGLLIYGGSSITTRILISLNKITNIFGVNISDEINGINIFIWILFLPGLAPFLLLMFCFSIPGFLMTIISNMASNNYVGEYRDDKRHGQGIYTYANGEEYVGEWRADKKHGQGTYTYDNGDKYVGEWKNDKFHGQGTYTHRDGTIEEGIWENGELKQ
jgi:hypothetical protein